MVIAMLIAVVGAALTGIVVVRLLGAQLEQRAASDRDATVRAAVDTVVAVAGERLGAQFVAGDRQLDMRNQAIDQRMVEMTGHLQRVSDLVSRLEQDKATQHTEFMSRLGESVRVTAQLSDTTRSLHQALGSPKARGQWGERMADDVLRIAGFREGVNYRKQTAILGGTIPDFTFLLPHDLVLHMDVKCPIDNYLRYLEAADDRERAAATTAFLRDVRARVKELAARGYADPSTTPGYLLLFIPNEAVYGFAHEHDPSLADLALGQRVVLCSPFTLFAVLGVVRQAVDCFMLGQASDEILEALGSFGLQWRKFSEHVDKLGRQLTAVHGTYDELAGTRRRQLQRKLDALDAIRRERGVGPGTDPEAGDMGGGTEMPTIREVRAG
jgi:DNA recombination protein RmuC